MGDDEIAFLSVGEAAAQIASGQLSPVELTDHILARIEKIDPSLNSYVTVMAEIARSAAREAEAAVRRGGPLGTLHGVPIALKDLYATKGIRTTFACAAFADWIPECDATVVERLAAAGAIILGKLNMREAAAGSSSLVSHHGPARNPFPTHRRRIEWRVGCRRRGRARVWSARQRHGDIDTPARSVSQHCGWTDDPFDE